MSSLLHTSRLGVSLGSVVTTPGLAPKRNALKHFSTAIGDGMSVELLSQLFTVHYSPRERLRRKHLGQVFYN